MTITLHSAPLAAVGLTYQVTYKVAARLVDKISYRIGIVMQYKAYKFNNMSPNALLESSLLFPVVDCTNGRWPGQALVYNLQGL